MKQAIYHFPVEGKAQTGGEIASLQLGAYTMALERGMRFLTDYLKR